MDTVAFSHFYKIPLVPKVTKFIFYNISSSLLILSFQKNVLYDKSMFALRKKYFFNGKPKMTKKIEFEKLKISQNDQISRFGIFNFSNSNFFCHFWFPIKTIFVFQSKYTLSDLSDFEADSINREEDILKGRFSHFRKWGIL